MNIFSIDEVSKIYPRPEYVTVIGFVDPRVAAKCMPDCKIINLIGPGGNSNQAYETFMNNLSKLQKVYEMLVDEESKKTFYGYWLGNISHRMTEFHYSSTPHYLMEGFIPKQGDIFIDVGACDGGTAVKFSNLGCKVYGFEMDKSNYEIAKKVAKEKKFVIEHYGLGSYEHVAKYSANEAASALNPNGTETAQIVTLDSYVEERKLSRVDWIKLDVEGAELDTLRGAATTIARFKPILALSAYHKWDDLWVLINFVKSVRSDYEFFLRQYPETKDDLPVWFTDNKEDYYASLGLEPDIRSWGECVLMAK